jgi:hypothetical protein
MSKNDLEIKHIVEDFMSAHSIEIWSRSVFPNWKSIWVIDGQVMRIHEVKRLLIPIVLKTIGPDPRALKQVIWKILSKIK